MRWKKTRRDRHVESALHEYFEAFISHQPELKAPSQMVGSGEHREPYMAAGFKYLYGFCLILIIFCIPQSFFIETKLGLQIGQSIDREEVIERISEGFGSIMPILSIQGNSEKGGD